MSMHRIDKLFNFEKGVLQSSKCEAGKYNFITAAAEWKTHKEYSYDCEALVFAAAASGSLGRTHYVNGKFISSDLCFIITPKDPKNLPIDLKFYHIIFNEFKKDIVKNTKAGTSKEAIGLTKFGSYELPYFEIEKQIEIKNQFVNSEKVKEGILTELIHQEELLKQLHQSFLSEAMQGKLVIQDKKDGNAKELLQKIKVEKTKLKKEKDLLPIREEEKPCDIPENWVWCRLNEVCIQIVDCPHSTPKYLHRETGYYGIDTTCIDDSGKIVRLRNLSKEGYEERVRRLVPTENDIVYAREGSIGLAAFIPKDKNICLGQRVMLFRSSSGIDSTFLKMVVSEESYKNRLLAKHRGMGAKHVNVKDIVSSIIPLPPLAEQKRIVKKLEEVMNLCEELKKTITDNQNYSNQLLQVALKDALQMKEVEVE